jgi:putative FmdB family regulatory protein
MPTYDYRCKACGHRFELFQAMSARPKRRCPECGRNALERLIGTGAALLFKGSGFYQTDYRSEGYKKAVQAEGKPAGDGKPETASSGATESVSADKATKPQPAQASGKPDSPGKKAKAAKRG